MIKNYIPINRKIFEHALWCEDREFSRFEAWIDMLQMARFEDTKQKRIIGNKIVEWNRCQLPGSLRFLANRWKWSTKKVTNYLNLLISEGMITKETPKETGQAIITICNYDKYNPALKKRKQQINTERNEVETPRKQGGNKTNKGNKENKENKRECGEETSPPPLKTFASSEDKKNILRARYKAGLAKEINTLFPHPTPEEQAELKRFIAYWCEPNKTLTKMKFELEKTWDTHLRIQKWFNNASKFELNRLPI